MTRSEMLAAVDEKFRVDQIYIAARISEIQDEIEQLRMNMQRECEALSGQLDQYNKADKITVEYRPNIDGPHGRFILIFEGGDV